MDEYDLFSDYGDYGVSNDYWYDYSNFYAPTDFSDYGFDTSWGGDYFDTTGWGYDTGWGYPEVPVDEWHIESPYYTTNNDYSMISDTAGDYSMISDNDLTSVL